MCLDISVSSGTTSNEVAYLRGEGRDDQSPGSRQSDTHTQEMIHGFTDMLFKGRPDGQQRSSLLLL